MGLIFATSENSDEGKDGDQMDVDQQPPPKKDPGDLSEYKLDDYDKETSEKGLLFIGGAWQIYRYV